MEVAIRRATEESAAGVLLFRRHEGHLQVLLVHPGGPFWATKDWGAWSIPKGEPEEGEGLLDAAIRELAEETGIAPHGETLLPLGVIRHRGGKVVYAWALERDWDPTRLHSNTFTTQWPPHSTRLETFPEIDRAEWFSVSEARRRILPGQVPLLDALMEAQLPPAALHGLQLSALW